MRTFGRLREEIRKKFGTLKKFANTMGMDVSTLSAKLNGQGGWKQSEMEKACELLGIPLDKVYEYFFYQ